MLPKNFKARNLNYGEEKYGQFNEPGIDYGFTPTPYAPEPPIAVTLSENRDKVPDIKLEEVVVASVKGFGQQPVRLYHQECIYSVNCEGGLWSNEGAARLLNTMFKKLITYEENANDIIIMSSASTINNGYLPHLPFWGRLGSVAVEDYILDPNGENWSCGVIHEIQPCPFYEVQQLITFARQYNRANEEYYG